MRTRMCPSVGATSLYVVSIKFPTEWAVVGDTDTIQARRIGCSAPTAGE